MDELQRKIDLLLKGDYLGGTSADIKEKENGEKVVEVSAMHANFNALSKTNNGHVQISKKIYTVDEINQLYE